MAVHMTLTAKMPLAQAARLIRARTAAAGEVWVFAGEERYRRLRRLHDRLQREPVPGGDMALFGHPLGSAIDGSGGMLVVSAHPFGAETD